jgi:hypothetical protein
METFLEPAEKHLHLCARRVEPFGDLGGVALAQRAATQPFFEVDPPPGAASGVFTAELDGRLGQHEAGPFGHTERPPERYQIIAGRPETVEKNDHGPIAAAVAVFTADDADVEVADLRSLHEHRFLPAGASGTKPRRPGDAQVRPPARVEGMRGVWVGLTLLPLLAAAGCMNRAYLEGLEAAAEPGEGAEPPAAPVAVQFAVGEAPDEATPDEATPDEATPDEATPRRSAAAVPSRNADRPLPEPVLFRLGAGHGALSLVDLRPCRDVGLPPGYLRMRVTFRPSGHVLRAAIESDAPPTPAALGCVGDQLELAMVPAFDGEDVTLSRIFFLN